MKQFPEQNSKSELRTLLRFERSKILHSESLTRAFTENLEKLFQLFSPSVVAGYLPFGNEPDVSVFLRALISKDIDVIMPITGLDQNLKWVHWNGQDSSPGVFSFQEARGVESELALAQLAIVPALAADLRGGRLGQGKGFYDRALANFSAVKAAVVFESEVRDKLPVEKHDQRIHFIVTEKRLIDVR
jgi:5-formyltetrahydrofolate cyclo-ligase